jgi:glycosyltransferase involved in cell wall biosynthesis
MEEGGKRVVSGDSGGAPPLISVVTASFNSAATIARAIRSVVSQSYRDFEYLVVDGASSDGTVGILQGFDEQIDYWRSEPDAGIYDAWNKGLRLARGRWIAFLGADDEYLPHALADYARLLASHDEGTLQYVSSRVELTRNGRRFRTVGKAWQWPKFSRYMCVSHVGSLHHRTLFEQYGEFDPAYRITGDYELLLRARGNLRAAFLPSTTARMAYGGVSTSEPVATLLETTRAKRISGGRAGWICALEFKIGRVKLVLHRWLGI